MTMSKCLFCEQTKPVAAFQNAISNWLEKPVCDSCVSRLAYQTIRSLTLKHQAEDHQESSEQDPDTIEEVLNRR